MIKIISWIMTISLLLCIDALLNCAIQNTKEFSLGKDFWIIGTNIGRFSMGWIAACYLPKFIEKTFKD